MYIDTYLISLFVLGAVSAAGYNVRFWKMHILCP